MGFLDLKSHDWKKGDWIYINKLVWDEKELNYFIECLAGDWFAGNSKWNKKFQDQVKNFIGMKFFQTTNSGTSALEIANQVLLQSGAWRRGDKIIHPALTFPTSISTAIMGGLTPVFIDAREGTYVINEDDVEMALKMFPEIRGAIIPALLGNTPDITRIKELLGDRPLIIDSCDVMGTKWNGKEVGSYGDFAAYSFYGSHHISTFGVGGGLGTNSERYAGLAESICFWGRDFSTDVLDPVENFLRRYSYRTIGLDAQMSAAQAAFGLGQFERLPEFLGERETVFHRLYTLFSKYEDYFILPKSLPAASVSWFCFPITMKMNTPFSREYFVEYLLENKIEIRPIMAGNLINHLPYSNSNFFQIGNLSKADEVSRRGFFIPACPMSETQLDYYIQILEKFLRRF